MDGCRYMKFEYKLCKCKKWMVGIEQVDRVVVKLEKMGLSSLKLGKKI